MEGISIYNTERSRKAVCNDNIGSQQHTTVNMRHYLGLVIHDYVETMCEVYTGQDHHSNGMIFIAKENHGLVILPDNGLSSF